MNIFAERVAKAFAECPAVQHQFIVTIELPELDARNHSDSGMDIQDVLLEKLSEISGLRTYDVSRA